MGGEALDRAAAVDDWALVRSQLKLSEQKVRDACETLFNGNFDFRYMTVASACMATDYDYPLRRSVM